MKTFPTHFLRPRYAVLSGTPDDASLIVPLHTFQWNDDGEEDTEIRLDRIRLPSLRPEDLGGRTFLFPLNDAAATAATPYIDGSIYLDDVHHPIDVNALAFQTHTEGVSVTIEGVYCFSEEGLDDYADTPFSLTAPLRFTGRNG